MWTPINTLASAIGAHIGFHPNRHGFTPFDIKKGGYEGVQNAKAVLGAAGDIGLGLSPLPSLLTDNRLVALYGESFKLGRNGFNESQSSKNPTGGWLFNSISLGGTNSVYGLIPNGKFPYRNEDTRDEKIVYKPNIIVERDRTKYYKTKYSPYTIFNQYGRESEAGIIIKADNKNSTDQQANHPIKSPKKAGKISDTERLFGLFKKLQPGASDDSKYAFGGGGIPKEDDNGATLIARNALGQDIGYTRDAGETITQYETIAYGNLPDRVAGDVEFHDFRSLLTETPDDPKTNESKRAKNANYKEHNINKRVGFGDTGRVANGEDRIRWWNTSPKSEGFLNRFDKVNAAEVGAAEVNDLVHLWFRADGGQKVQFRGTVSGITDTFAPSWNAVKYNGRADQAYNYSTFERSLSFSFKVMATSRVEMKPIWNKLSYLSTMTMPKYGGDSGYQGTLIYFRLGSLYNNKLAFIESLTYSISDEVAWEISPKGTDNPLGEIPKMVDVSIGLKILGNSRPAVGESSGVYEANFLTKSEELRAEEQSEQLEDSFEDTEQEAEL